MGEFDHLLYISKSKKQVYDMCPYAFKLGYVDKIPQGENPYFKIGIDVHEFIDTFFDIVVPLDSGELQNISSLQYHPNTEYKKNVAKFEIERWRNIHNAGFDISFFIPVEKEKKWQVENPKLVGVVDRVHKCCKIDPFASSVEEFKNGDLVIVENKTGKMTKEKCKNYESDMLWYKIIMEIVNPELAPIKWGAIYFPESNYVHHCKLLIEDCRILARSIHTVRENIRRDLITMNFVAKPSIKVCGMCNYAQVCDKRMVK